MSNDFARCVAKHPDGRWLYHLLGTGQSGTLSVLADGQPMNRIGETNWWAADHQADRITILSKTGLKTTGYELRDPETASVKFPAELTVEQWQERCDNNGGSVPDYMWNLYRSVTVDHPPTETHIDGPFTVLEGGEPPATADGPAWNPNLIDSITQRPEYRHLFPGYLSGLRKHMVDHIKRMPRVNHCFDGFQSSTAVYVSLLVPFEQTETTWVANINRRGQTLKSGRTVQKRAERVLHLPITDTVPGDNYAAARAEWDRQVAFWTQAVTDASVAACNHCRGTGHIPAGSETYTTTK